MCLLIDGAVALQDLPELGPLAGGSRVLRGHARHSDV
jgi:hypothetical protein